MQDLLPAGGLRLFREGVEPSGSLQKVSGYISILLLRPLPDASSIRLPEGSVLSHHGMRRTGGSLLLGLPSVSPMRCWLGRNRDGITSVRRACIGSSIRIRSSAHGPTNSIEPPDMIRTLETMN